MEPSTKHRWTNRSGILTLLGLTAAVLLLFAWTTWMAGPDVDLKTLGWRTDLTQAVTEASDANKPVIVYFTADWCGPCQIYRREVLVDPRLAEALQANVIPVVIDIDQPGAGQDLFVKLGLIAIPTTLAITPEMKPIDLFHWDGSTEAVNDFLNWLPRVTDAMSPSTAMH